MKKLIIPIILVESFILSNCVSSYSIEPNHTDTFTYKGLEYWTITLTEWDVSITMLDRNLWADAYMNQPWATSGQWMGKYYQRWSTQERDLLHSGKVSSDYSDNDADDRWWAQDTYENWYYTKRDSDRRWPCPEGYHVPSSNERSMLFYIFQENFHNTYSNTDDDIIISSYRDTPWPGAYVTSTDYYSDAESFFNLFLMPFPWRQNIYNGIAIPYNLWSEAIYWNSSTYKDEKGGFIGFADNTFYLSSETQAYKWASVRCFKDDNNDYSAYFLALRPGHTWFNYLNTSSIVIENTYVDSYTEFIHPYTSWWIIFTDRIDLAFNFDKRWDCWWNICDHGRRYWNIKPKVLWLPNGNTYHWARFIGWFKWSNPNNLTEEFKSWDELTENTILYAKWDTNNIDPRYFYYIKDWDDTVYTWTEWSWGYIDQLWKLEENIREKNSSYNNKYRSWYTLIWLYKDASLTIQHNSNSPLTSDTTLYTRWQAPTFTVMFESNWGSYITPQTIEEWMHIPIPLPIPNYPNHNFIWWYIDSDLNIPFDETASIQEDITLYAKRESNNHNISTTYTLTINYQDNSGNKLHEPRIETLNTWSWYSITSPDISWYSTTQTTISGILNKDTTIDVIYTKDDNTWWNWGNEHTYTLTIYYKYTSDDTQASNTITMTLSGWAIYEVLSPIIPNYTASQSVVRWTMPNSDKSITVTYTHNNSWWGWGWWWSSITSILSIDYPTENTIIKSLPVILYWRWQATNFYKFDYILLKNWSIYKAWETSSRFIEFNNLPNWNYEFKLDLINTSREILLNTWVRFIVNVNNLEDSSSSTNEENFIELSTNRKSPTTNQYINLTINTNQNYKDKLYFNIQYRQNSSDWRLSISNTSYTYLSDYSDDWEKGFYKMKSNDAWEITLKNIVKFKKSWQYKIYVKDIEGNSKSIQFNVSWDDDDENNSKKSKLSISLINENPETDSRIWIILETNSDYVGKISFPKIEYYSSSRKDISSSSEYIWNSSDEWEDGYYKMTSKDYWYKRISNFVKLKKEWKYRIHAKATDWATDYIQFYVNESDYEKESDWEETTQKEIEEMINRILNPTWTTNYDDYSYLGWNYSYKDDNGVERNKNNIGYMTDETYKSRSCKEYRLHYDPDLWVFTSPDLQKTEYFINKNYFKRYIDSKNPQKNWCPTNIWRISTNYNDSSTNSENFIAPNGKVYFIQQKNWKYYSNNLNTENDFPSLIELKFYIRDRNPLIKMSS